MKVTILHPDLGIGGAERLVLDAAQAFRIKGHYVQIVTNHYSPSHCFSDLLTFKNVIVIGGFTRTIFGKFYALCAYIRICIAAIYICLMHRDTDIIFCDQISAPLFIFRLFLTAKLLFYCHYPDQLLTTRKSVGKVLYRAILDRIECWTTGLADIIFVNSHYTESVFRSTFVSLAAKPVEVLYPCLNTDYIDELLDKLKGMSENELFLSVSKNLNDKSKLISTLLSSQYEHIFLSFNRFEIKKNIELAIHAFEMLRNNLSKDEFGKCALILAGGYDTLNVENILYHKKLIQIVDEMGLQDCVFFILSPDDNLKFWLYQRSTLVVYTPLNEHFGIVPLEAMYMGLPVLATNSGGPLETIVEGETGFLCDNKPNAFSCVMLETIQNKKMHRLGENGNKRVAEFFSFFSFVEKLNTYAGRDNKKVL